MPNDINEMKKFINNIKKLVEKRSDNAKTNVSKKAIVNSINEDGTVNILINGELYSNVKVRPGFQPKVNEVVLVNIPNGNFKDMYVDLASTFTGGENDHTHSNLSLLETITQTLINAWNSAVSHISDAVKHITSSERDLWNTVSNKVDSTEVATTATPNKILKLDSNSKLPASITGNADGNASTATKLQAARTISLSGDVTGLASFDGSADASITTALSNTGVTAGTYTKVTVDTKGRVTTGTTLSATDIPNLDWSKITTGKPTTLSGYGITDAVSSSDVTTTPTANKILKLDVNAKLPASITGNADGNATTATKLQTARTISLSGDVTGSADFDGSSNITINATVVDDSHNHIISNVDGLQVALDGKSDIDHSHNLANLAERNYTSLVGRPADDDFHMLTELLDSANDDELVIYDTSDGTYKKITKQNLFIGFLNNDQYVFIKRKEEFVATEGQTVFNLTQGSYKIGTGRIDVYIWGNKQPPTAYVESSSTSITLVNGVEAGTKVLIEYIQIANVIDYVHASTHAMGGSDPLSPADIGAETPSGAQAKADQAEANAKAYADSRFTTYEHPSVVAGTGLGHIKSGGDITVDTSGIVFVNDNSHNHGNATITDVDWSKISNKPSSTVANIDDAVNKKHSQNTDNTLTNSSANTINTTGTGNIVDFKVNNITKASIDNAGKFIGTIDWNNVSNKPDPTITLSGDVSGSATMTDLGSVTINTTVADDSHNHVISNIDNLQTELDSKALKSTIIIAGSGLTGGGDLSSNRTISHADTSTQASVNNSNGVVIQDVTLDDYGHITGLGSVDLDSRYYTETEVNNLLSNKSDVSHNHALASLSEKNYTSLVGRPADDDFHMLTELLDSANDDELVIYDVSDSSYKKITRENLLAGLLSSSQFVFIRKKEEFTATEGQTAFNLTQGSYEVGTGRVDVYIWGNKQPPSAYTETSSTSITLVNGVEAGTKVLIEYIQIANVMDYIHAQNHKIGGSDPITPADIGAASQSHTHVKTDITDFSHTHSISEITNLQISLNGKVNTSDVVTTATANKILKLDSNANLPANITGNATTASKLQTARTITLSGDVSGSASFDGSSNVTINATVVDDSHNHVISNIDNLQSTLDAKASVSHTHTSSEITGFNEATQDAIGAILTDTSTIDFTYDDTNNQIKADVKPNSSNQKVAVSKNNTTPTGTRKQINFKDGTNISVSVADNATNDAVDVTITNTYTHPTGDGNLHVPATGTTNNNKVLKAGSTAGSLSWGNVAWSELTNKPSSSVSSIDNAVTNSHTHSNKALLDTYTQTEANLADAVSKKHAQNTDNTLTSSSSNTINTTGTGNIVDFKVNNTTKSSIDNKGNFTGKSASADKLATARTITLTGDVTGSASFDGSANISISATVADDSHNHVISNIDNLQTTLNSKAPLASPAFTGTPTAPTAPNGTNTNQIATTKFVQNALSAGGYGDMLKSQYDTDSDGIVDRAETADKLTTARTISLTGDVRGSASFDGSGNISINATVADNSHNHTISNITNLQTSLDGKTKRINLTGQCQASSYKRSVIALVEVTNTNPRLNSNTQGIITFHRSNGLSGNVMALVNMEKRYNTTRVNYHGLTMGLNANNIRPCTFTYNGIKYGGIEFFFSDAELSNIEFNGMTNFNIFGIDYYDTRGTILNSEIYNSLNFSDVNWINGIYMNNTAISKEGHTHDRINGIKISVGSITPPSPQLNDIWIDTSS